jgi:hypothetical protein
MGFKDAGKPHYLGIAKGFGGVSARAATAPSRTASYSS